MIENSNVIRFVRKIEANIIDYIILDWLVGRNVAFFLFLLDFLLILELQGSAEEY